MVDYIDRHKDVYGIVGLGARRGHDHAGSSGPFQLLEVVSEGRTVSGPEFNADEPGSETWATTPKAVPVDGIHGFGSLRL